MTAIPPSEYEAFFHELRALLRRLRNMGEHLHRDKGLSQGEKSFLAELEATGPRTLPSLARSRSVSRQHVQAMAHELAGLGLVAAQPNPAHRRSHHLVLTPEGKARLAAMRGRERAALAALDLPFEPGQLQRLALELHRVRGIFETVHAPEQP